MDLETRAIHATHQFTQLTGIHATQCSLRNLTQLNATQCSLIQLTATRFHVHVILYKFQKIPNPRYVFAIIVVGALTSIAVLVAVQISIIHEVKGTTPNYQN